jgi:hypothetical protein
MAVNAKALPFAISGTTGITLAHNMGVAPQVALLFAARQNATTDGQDAQIVLSLGACSATDQFAVSTWVGSPGAGNTQSASVFYSDGCLVLPQDATNGFSGYASKRVQRNSWDTADADFDVFEDYSPNGFNHRGMVLLLGGTTITNSAVGTFKQNTADNAVITVTLGWQPDCVILIGGTIGNNTEDTVGAETLWTQGGITLGWFTETAQGAIGFDARHNLATSDSNSLISTTHCLTPLWDTGAGQRCSLTPEATAMIATGFEVRRQEDVDSTTYRPWVGYIALKGAVCVPFTTTTQDATGTWGVTVTGCNPKAVLLATTNRATATESYPPTQGGEFSFGFGTAASEQGSVWGMQQDGVAQGPSQHRINTSNRILMNYANTSAYGIVGDVSLSSLSSGTVTLDQTDADEAERLVIGLAIGETAASNETLTADPGSFTISGTAATFNYTLTASPGAFDISGTDATLTSTGNSVLTAESGVFQISDGDAGEFLITGTDAGFGVALSCAAGAFAITGTDATFVDSGNVSYSVACDPGSFVITGTEATLLYTVSGNGHSETVNRRRRFK